MTGHDDLGDGRCWVVGTPLTGSALPVNAYSGRAGAATALLDECVRGHTLGAAPLDGTWRAPVRQTRPDLALALRQSMCGRCIGSVLGAGATGSERDPPLRAAGRDRCALLRCPDRGAALVGSDRGAVLWPGIDKDALRFRAVAGIGRGVVEALGVNFFDLAI